MSKLVVFISWALFLLLPFYYADSGQLQPVDAAIITLFIVFIIMRLPNLNHLIKNSYAVKIFLYLSLYTFLILLMHIIIDYNEIGWILLRQNIYFFLIFLTFIMLISYCYITYNYQNFYKLMISFLAFGSLLPLLKLISTGSLFASTRAGLTFNNPNQLGFYALVNIAILFYLLLLNNDYGNKNKMSLIVLMNINMLFLFNAASRACDGALLLYALSYPLLYKNKVKGYWRRALDIGAIVFVLCLGMIIVHSLIAHMQVARRTDMSSAYMGLSNDFYFRALRGLNEDFHVVPFLLGNGQYGNDVRGTLEFHNNFIAIFHQIGIIGLLLYIAMNIVVLKSLYRYGIMYVLPYLCYLFYSMMHYSYRARYNWLFLAFVFFVIMLKKSTQKKNNSQFSQRQETK